MVYVTPTTRATDDMITATVWNQDVVDNMKHLAGMKAGNTALSALPASSRISTLNEIVPWTKLSANAAGITLSSIPSEYDALLLLMKMRSDAPGVTSDSLLVTFNGDTTAANYNMMVHNINGSGTSGKLEYFGTFNGLLLPYAVTGATANANLYGLSQLWIYDYSAAALTKHVQWQCNRLVNRATDSLNYFLSGVGEWENTSVGISSLAIAPYSGPNIVANSSYALYGIGRTS